MVVISASFSETCAGLAASWAPIGMTRTRMALQICGKGQRDRLTVRVCPSPRAQHWSHDSRQCSRKTVTHVDDDEAGEHESEALVEGVGAAADVAGSRNDNVHPLVVRERKNPVRCIIDVGCEEEEEEEIVSQWLLSRQLRAAAVSGSGQRATNGGRGRSSPPALRTPSRATRSPLLGVTQRAAAARSGCCAHAPV